MTRELLTTDDLAQRFGHSRTRIQEWCREGQLPNAQKAGPRGAWPIPKSDIASLNIRPRYTQLCRRLTRPEYEVLGLKLLA